MRTRFTRRWTNVSLLGACIALLASACAVSPASKTAGGAAGQTPVAAPAKQGPWEFTHTSADLLARIDLGWNLGNTLDVPFGETAWGNPETAPELLDAVAKAGFGLVRIPVTWTTHMGPAPDYVIDPAWFDRVEEVVGYARDAGLYAIVNLHHDGAKGFKEAQWITLNDSSGNPTDENEAAVMARFTAVWTQIAKRFSNYGEELLFESMNEIRVDSGQKTEPRHFAFVNDLNQRFVDVVRASGGNNARRHLVVPGYNTDIKHTVADFALPVDPTPNRLIVTIHYYVPGSFTLRAKTQTWGQASPGRDDRGQEDAVVEQFDKVKASFTDRGIPVLLGEYGATHQDGFEDYRRYYLEYVTKVAVDRGILPVFWDNGGMGSGNENHALMDRRNNTVLRPELLEAMLRAATSSYSLSDIRLPTPGK